MGSPEPRSSLPEQRRGAALGAPAAGEGARARALRLRLILVVVAVCAAVWLSALYD